jgi:hypothetical protein
LSIPAGDGELVSQPSTDFAWVFSTSPSDFGGVAVVGAQGLTLFAGSIIWSGTGEIVFPTAWSMSDLGSGCSPKRDALPVRGIDLSSSDEFASDAAGQLALDSVLPTIWRKWGGDISRLLVLLYPRTGGAFDAKNAEYIVFLNGYTAGG